MTKEFMRRIAELDEAAERAGGYLAPPSAKRRAIGHDYHALSRYCKERGVEPSSLSAAELESFRI